MKGHKKTYNADGSIDEFDSMSFKGHVSPLFALEYLKQAINTLESSSSEELGIRRLIDQIKRLDVQQGVQLFANLHMLHQMVINVMDMANEIASSRGYKLNYHKTRDEDEADIEVTVSVLEDFEVIAPAGLPELGNWSDDENTDLAFIGITE